MGKGDRRSLSIASMLCFYCLMVQVIDKCSMVLLFLRIPLQVRRFYIYFLLLNTRTLPMHLILVDPKSLLTVLLCACSCDGFTAAKALRLRILARGLLVFSIKDTDSRVASQSTLLASSTP